MFDKVINNRNILMYLIFISQTTFLFRFIYHPIKYLFIFFSIVTIIYILFKIKTIFYLIKKQKPLFIIYITPFILFIIYLINIFRSDKVYSITIIELLNFAIVFICLAFLGLYSSRSELNLVKKSFLSIILYSIFFLGIIGIIKYIFNTIGLNFPLLFLKDEYFALGISLVPDNNFYSLFFILAVVLFLKSIKENWIQKRFLVSQLFLINFTANIIFSFSRRGILIYVLLLITGIFYLLSRSKHQNFNHLKKVLQTHFAILGGFVILLCGLWIFRYEIFESHYIQQSISTYSHKFYTIINGKISYEDFESKLWHYKKNDEKEPDNLLYNGNFENGLRYWYIGADHVSHELIDTPYGKGIRVERTLGKGYWPLLYKGRQIYYYKDATYTFSFYFKVVKGEDIPFNIGWWVKDNSKRIISLKKDITHLTNGWSFCECKYTFKQDHDDITHSFMNSQKAGTIVEFADIKLTVNDYDKRLNYVDQVKKTGKGTALPVDNQFTSPRISRWNYFEEIWNTRYNFTDKLFGKGFDYLKWYGDKFFIENERLDWPHNPFLSILLYSGITGWLFYILLLYKVVYYYWLYRKDYALFGIFFLITFFFSFFSANSPFDPPVMGFFVILPFFIHYIHTKEKSLSLKESEK